MEHDAESSRRYKENWEDAVQASKADAAEIAELKEAYALLFKDNALLRQVHADFRRECGDTDAILRVLGLDPVNCRTDGGSLKLAMISGALECRDVIRKREATEALRGERDVLVRLLLEADKVLSTIEGECQEEWDQLADLRRAIAAATIPHRPEEADLLSMRACIGR